MSLKNISLRNNKGFSLIELMVVVAIIAILATIAIPSYQGFQAKARQKEGLGLLNGYYTSAQATYAEVGGFPGDFVGTGFAPAGQLGYRISSAIDAGVHTNIMDSGFGSYDPACINTMQPCTCAAGPSPCPNFMTWDEKAPGTVAMLGPTVPTMAAVNMAGQNFETIASGFVKSGTGAMADERSINERKVITQYVDGLQ